ncbi:MAG: glycosyltransferase family 4 protein [Planctomycetota bacterium]
MNGVPSEQRREPLRTVILSPSAELGGAERSLLTFLRCAGPCGVDATVLLPRPGPLAGALCSGGVAWQVVPQPRALRSQSRALRPESLAQLLPLAFQGPRYLVGLARAVSRLRPDVLYTNGVKGHVLAAVLRPFLHVPSVWHVHVHWGGRLAALLADLAPDRVIANSRSTADVLRGRMRDPAKVSVIHNAVDLEEFRPKGPAAQVPDVPPSALRVALPAAFASLKGHKLLLQAAAAIRDEVPAARFLFIGGSIYDTAGHNGYERELRRTVARMGLQRHVTFTGFQCRMAPWYRASDVVVNSSAVPEGFARTLLEAMACGRAVVGPDAGGVPEFVRDDHNGLLYPMGDAGGLVRALLRLLRSRPLRARLGAAGRRTAVERFGMEPHAVATARVLRLAAAGRRAAPLAASSTALHLREEAST